MIACHLSNVQTFDDLSVTLQMMDPELRQLLHLLSLAGYGAERDLIGQPFGLLSWLDSYLQPAAGGSSRLCLASAQHRALFQVRELRGVAQSVAKQHSREFCCCRW